LYLKEKYFLENSILHITVEMILLHTEIIMTYVLKKVVRKIWCIYTERDHHAAKSFPLFSRQLQQLFVGTWRGPSTSGASGMKRLRMTSKTQYPPACTRPVRSIAAKLLIALVAAFVLDLRLGSAGALWLTLFLQLHSQ